MDEEKMNTEAAQENEAPKQEPEKKRRRSLTDRLYAQLEILEREQEKIASGYDGSSNPKSARSEYPCFRKTDHRYGKYHYHH